MLRFPSAQRPRLRALALAAMPWWLVACASPPPAPLDPTAMAAEISRRATSMETVREALELAAVGPLALTPPALSSEAPDPDAPEIWHASAWAFGAGPRAARRRLLHTRALINSSGLPEPLMLSAQSMEVSAPDRMAEVALTFDLLGVLGLGRAEAARALAQSEERAALGELEEVIWNLPFEVDRRRIQLATTLAKSEALAALAREAAQDQHRLEILEKQGWVSASAQAVARTAYARLLSLLLSLEEQAEAERSALAMAVGLAAGAELLHRITPATLDSLPTPESPPPPDARHLLENHPRLRSLRLRYAVAEAGLRQAAAGSWPALRLGPMATLATDDLLPGGMLQLELPFPGRVAAEVEVALQERQAAREELEAALVEQVAEVARLRAGLLAAQQNLEAHAPEIAQGTKTSWRAARALFFADPAELDRWGMELERRVMGIQEVLDRRLDVLETLLAYLQACGPTAQPSTASDEEEEAP